jgi:hypothetical protein
MILAQETIWGRKSPSKVAVYLRVFSRDALYLGMLCLGWWAGKALRAMAAAGAGDLQSRQRFIRKNAELQRELGRFYAPTTSFARLARTAVVVVKLLTGSWICFSTAYRRP